MAKKQAVPQYILNKFKRPQFQVNDIVYFTWLGEPLKGKVIRYAKNNENVTYTIQSGRYKYPCGIQIKKHKSAQYGLVLYEKSRNYTGNIRKPGGEIDASTNDSGSGGRYVDNTVRSISEESGSGHGTKNDNKLSNTKHRGKDISHRNPVSGSRELESAINKQKQFLRGFTKK